MTTAGAEHSELYWSEELEELHEESSRTHFLDVWTRAAMLARVGDIGERPSILDLGCSTGYLLEDLRAGYPTARLVGLDFVFSGLPAARENQPDARVLQGDACASPLADRSFDAVVSANLLEHIPDDVAALAEIRRVLRPGRRAVLVVPAAPQTYDYYDRYLRHQRRYGRGELARKARSVGLEVLGEAYLGSLIYPAFWAVKRLNRLRFDHLAGDALRARVALDIANTKDSRIGHATVRIEKWLLERGIRLPVGVRNLVVIRRPPDPKRGDE